MPPPRKPPRPWFDKKAGTWHIRYAGWKSGVVGHGYEAGQRSALAALGRYTDELAQSATAPEAIPPAPDTFAAILPDYLEHLIDENRPSAPTATIEVRHLLPFWYDKTPIDVTMEQVKKYRDARKLPKADSNGIMRAAGNSTVAREIRTLQAAANIWGKSNGGVKFDFWRPRESIPRETWLTPEEAAQLLCAARHIPRLRRFLLVALYAGRRRKAIMDLTWDQVNLDTGTIDFRRRDRRETKKRRGLIVAPQSFLAHLRRWKRMDDTIGATHLIHEDGKIVGNLRKGFKGAVRRSGIRKRIDSRTLKHTAVTWAAIRRIDIRDAAIYFATTIDTLESVYQEHAPEILERVAREMERSIR